MKNLISFVTSDFVMTILGMFVLYLIGQVPVLAKTFLVIGVIATLYLKAWSVFFLLLTVLLFPYFPLLGGSLGVVTFLIILFGNKKNQNVIED